MGPARGPPGELRACPSEEKSGSRGTSFGIRPRGPKSHPQAAIGKSLDSHCPAVAITLDEKRADYVLEAIDTGAGAARKPYKFTLFDSKGDRLFSTETRALNNAVKDVCGFIRKQKR